MESASGSRESPAVLVVGSGSPERARLLAMLERAGWRVLATGAVRQSTALLGNVSVVICDDDLIDGTWRDVLAAVFRVHSPPALIVTLPSVGPHLWAEILNLGGYGALAQPFSFEKALWSVQQAHEVATANTVASKQAGVRPFGHRNASDSRETTTCSWPGTCTIGDGAQRSTSKR